MSSNRTSSSKKLCFGATSWVWFSCSFSNFVFLGELLEDDEENELDLKEIWEKEHKSRDIVITSSSIYAFLWYQSLMGK